MSREPSQGVVRIPQHLAAEALSARGPTFDSRAVPGMNNRPAKTHEPGADTVRRILHPDFTLVERMNRVLPDQSWFSPGISPTSPVQFEINSFEVPRNMDFWLFDYQFSVLVQSGEDPYDAIDASPGRFSGVMGFDVQIWINKRQGDLKYQIDPTSFPTSRAAFGGSSRTASDFNSAQFSSASLIGGVGSSMLPVRSNVQGPRNGVFTYILKQNEPIVQSCIIFRRLMRPVYCIQATLSGYLVHQNVSREIIEQLRPM